MDKLLHWSLEAAKDPEKAGKPDPEQLAKLFGNGGADDRTQMKEALQVAVQSEDQPERVLGLETFEELVEDTDNANNLGNLWEPLLFLVNDKNADVRALALSSIASAVQNNEKAQSDLVATKSGIPTIMEYMNDEDSAVAAKALLAVASAVGHCPPAYQQFDAAKGWEILSYMFDAEEVGSTLDKKQQRMVTLVQSLVLLQEQVPTFPALARTGIVAKLENWFPHAGSGKERLENVFKFLKDHNYGEKLLLAGPPKLLPVEKDGDEEAGPSGAGVQQHSGFEADTTAPAARPEPPS